MADRVPVVVVGAGLAGLVTARELERAGVGCRVLEAAPRAGGRVETVTLDDDRVAEAHMEEFWSSSPAFPLLQELGLPLELDTAQSGMVLDGQLCRVVGDGDRDEYLAGTFRPLEAAAFLRFGEDARGVADRLHLDDPARAPDELRSTELDELLRESFASYVRRHLPQRRVAEWIRVVVESETAVEWDRIAAADGLAELLPFLDTPTGFGELAAHVVGGNERFVAALVASLPEGTVRLDQPVTRVRQIDAGVEVRHGSGEVTSADLVVVTVPSWSLPTLGLEWDLAPSVNRALRTAAAGSYVKGLLRLRPEARELWERHGPGVFTLLTDSDAGCLYLVDDTPGLEPLLTMLVPGARARALCAVPPLIRAGRLRAALDQVAGGIPLWPGLGDLVVETRVLAYPKAVAYWPVSSGRSRFDEAAHALRGPHGRLWFAGDSVESSHSDGAVRSGRRVAREVVARLGGSDVLLTSSSS